MIFLIFITLTALCATLQAFQVGQKGILSHQIRQLQAGSSRARHRTRLDMMFGLSGSTGSKLNRT